MPSVSVSEDSPENSASVPFCRVTRYCSGVSCCFHSASDLLVLLFVMAMVKYRAKTSGRVSTLPPPVANGLDCLLLFRLVDCLLQFNSRRELCHFARRNLDGCPGLRIAAVARLAL